MRARNPEPVTLPTVTDVYLQAARPEFRDRGVLGWIEFTIAGLRIQAVTLRRTARGRLTLSYPPRRLVRGHRCFYVRPVDDSTRRHIEREVFRALNLEEVPR